MWRGNVEQKVAQRATLHGWLPKRHPCMCHSNGHQVPVTQRGSAAVSRRCTFYFFKWHRGSDQSEHRSHILRTNFPLGELGRVASSNPHWSNSACRISVLPLDHRKLTPNWWTFWAVFNRAVATRVNSTEYETVYLTQCFPGCIIRRLLAYMLDPGSPRDAPQIMLSSASPFWKDTPYREDIFRWTFDVTIGNRWGLAIDCVTECMSGSW